MSKEDNKAFVALVGRINDMSYDELVAFQKRLNVTVVNLNRIVDRKLKEKQDA